ncbi:helix-turn-helix domain-containing protein [Enterovirga rhinocerotis]|uniref:Helix-turn-helix protein n=1 Tax=Enterovirga rhinocerotis TaxID=1339210 RepID=A0A4R7BW45_9HYPH|nr:helix-turn-helix domain-containing protein [Enterovirga rhinocerotis]TDR88166.1 helix-turn-helix protein [Enterovirga rhinocerotis]
MGKPVMFKTPNGEKMVVLALADYEALLAANDPEDAADVAAFDEAMAALDSGEDRRLTSEEMAAYYQRPGFLRGLRKGKGLTQRQVAEAAGIQQGFLSDVEAGRRNPSEDTLRKITAALGA